MSALLFNILTTGSDSVNQQCMSLQTFLVLRPVKVKTSPNESTNASARQLSPTKQSQNTSSQIPVRVFYLRIYHRKLGQEVQNRFNVFWPHKLVLFQSNRGQFGSDGVGHLVGSFVSQLYVALVFVLCSAVVVLIAATMYLCNNVCGSKSKVGKGVCMSTRCFHLHPCVPIPKVFCQCFFY